MDKMTDRLWDEYEEGFLELLRIPSVYDEKTASKEMPFGKYSHDALLYMKNVLENEGFSVTMYDDAVISAEYGDGPDDERIDIVSHLDVVEPGEGWTYPPFAAVKKDGRIIARGSQDMKSGAWLTFLGLKHLKDTGYVPNRKLRLVYGSDEERTMDDMKTYVRVGFNKRENKIEYSDGYLTMGRKGIGKLSNMIKRTAFIGVRFSLSLPNHAGNKLSRVKA